jgi:hypothetical protein
MYPTEPAPNFDRGFQNCAEIHYPGIHSEILENNWTDIYPVFLAIHA